CVHDWPSCPTRPGAASVTLGLRRRRRRGLRGLRRSTTAATRVAGTRGPGRRRAQDRDAARRWRRPRLARTLLLVAVLLRHRQLALGRVAAVLGRRELRLRRALERGVHEPLPDVAGEGRPVDVVAPAVLEGQLVLLVAHPDRGGEPGRLLVRIGRGEAHEPGVRVLGRCRPLVAALPGAGLAGGLTPGG